MSSPALLPLLAFGAVIAVVIAVVLVRSIRGLVLHSSVLGVAVLCLDAERRQVGVVAHWHGQAHGGQHGILLGLFDLALLLLDAGGLGGLGLVVALCVPAEVAALLPAADGGHDGVAQVVFALRIVLDVFPLEVGAAAAGGC